MKIKLKCKLITRCTVVRLCLFSIFLIHRYWLSFLRRDAQSSLAASAGTNRSSQASDKWPRSPLPSTLVHCCMWWLSFPTFLSQLRQFTWCAWRCPLSSRARRNRARHAQWVFRPRVAILIAGRKNWRGPFFSPSVALYALIHVH